MSFPNDALEKFDREMAAMTKATELSLGSPAAEAMRTLDRSFAETALKATRALSVSREYKEMQRKFQSISESSLMKAMREIESPLLAAVKPQKLWPPHLTAAAVGTLRPSDFEEKLLKMESTLAGDFMKKVAAMDSIGGNVLKQLSKMESSVGRDFSAKFLEANNAAASVWNSSAIRLAQTLSDNFPKFDERIVDALREFKAIGDLQPGPAEISGIGAITEAADTIAARGSVIGDETDKNPQSALVIWWKKQPFEVQAFLLVLWWFLSTGAAAVIQERVKEWMGATNSQERQIIYNEVTQNFGADTARRLRCVRASTLKVRSEASTTGKIVDSLPRGTAVEVLESQGSWSLIRYRVPHSSNIREGWAASGYLSLEIC